MHTVTNKNMRMYTPSAPSLAGGLAGTRKQTHTHTDNQTITRTRAHSGWETRNADGARMTEPLHTHMRTRTLPRLRTQRAGGRGWGGGASLDELLAHAGQALDGPGPDLHGAGALAEGAI